MSFTVQILGSNSAIPCHGRHPSAQVVTVDHHNLLIDCGEGTQIQMDRYKVKKFRIGHILISHLHGDHIYGLPGYLTSMNLLGRTDALTITGPSGTRRFVEEILTMAGVSLAYDLNIDEKDCQSLELIFEDDVIAVHGFPLDHRIQTNGYLITKKELPRRLDGRKADVLSIPFEWRRRIKAGEDYIDKGGKVIKNSDLTRPGLRQYSYAYCSDTRYKKDLSKWLSGIDVLYHEATFTTELSEQASERYHSTALQAGKLAKDCGVGQLIIGHASSRYPSFDPLVEEARSIFANSHPAEEGVVFDVLESWEDE